MKIIKYIGFLLLVIFSLNFIGAGIINMLYNNNLTGQSGGKINDFLYNYDDVSILAVGNSRCAHHIVPDSLGEYVFNLSHNGMSIVFQAGIIYQLFEVEKKHVDTVLLQIDISEYITKDFQKHNTDILYLKQFYHQNQWIKKETNQYFPYERLKQLLPLYKWNGKSLNIIKNNIETTQGDIPYKGYVPYPATDRDSINVEWSNNKQIKEGITSIDFQVNPRFKKYISQINEVCEQNDIVLVCFTSPSYYQNDIVFDNATLFFDSLGVGYFNYAEKKLDEIGLNSIWLWNDASHLNHEGAKTFTQVLREDLSY